MLDMSVKVLLFTLFAALPMWVALLMSLIVYYEVRRAKRIKRNLPLEGEDQLGFEVELKQKK